MEDEGTSVAPPRRSAPIISSADAVPALVISADAVPAPVISAEAVPAPVISSADAVPAPVISSAEAEPTTSVDLEDNSTPSVSADAEPTSSDDLEDIHPQGSSRATGGILRGRAAASYYSPADEENIFYDSIGTAKLTAKIYTSDLDPLNLNRDNMVPSSKVTIKMNPNLGPILDNISQRYPAIKGIC